MNTKKILLLCISTASISLALAEQTIKSLSVSNKLLAQRQTFSLGNESVSPETEQCIRHIIKDMNMENYHIEIFSMNNYGKNLYGFMNAVVLPSFFRSKSNFLYISQDWFNTLSQQEKRALIGHELIHIRNKHIPKKVMILIASCFFNSVLAVNLIRCIEPDAFDIRADITFRKKFFEMFAIELFMLFFYFSNGPRNWYSRFCEKEADIQSAQLLDCAEGAAELWAQFICKTNAEKSLFKKSLTKIPYKKVRTIIKFLFLDGTHPQPKKRVAYMKKLALESKQNQCLAAS